MAKYEADDTDPYPTVIVDEKEFGEYWIEIPGGWQPTIVELHAQPESTGSEFNFRNHRGAPVYIVPEHLCKPDDLLEDKTPPSHGYMLESMSDWEHVVTVRRGAGTVVLVAENPTAISIRRIARLYL